MTVDRLADFGAAWRAGDVDRLMSFMTGDRGASQWAYPCTTADGTVIEVQGCDLYKFAGDRIRVKDAYRKVHGDITQPTPGR